MSTQKLTDRTLFASTLEDNDLVHIVDVSDSSQNPAGSSYKLRLSQLKLFLDIQEIQDELDDHIADTDNPHSVTKSQVGLGNVDNTSDVNKPVSTAQAAADAVVLSTANAYSDSLLVSVFVDCGNWDASGGLFPTTGGTGTAGAIKKGNAFEISVAGTMGGEAFDVGDIIRALVNTPGQTLSNWAVSEHNIQQATTTVRGTAKLAVTSEVDTGTENTKIITAAALEASKYLGQAQAKIYAVASGTDTYTASLTPVLTTLTAGLTVHIKFTNANTGASTLNIDSLGAIAIKKDGVAALAAGDIKAGSLYSLTYDGSVFQSNCGEALASTVIYSSFGTTIDGQGGVISTGSKGFIAAFPYPCTITKWYVKADVSGSIQIDLKRSGTSIIGGGGNKPILSSAQSANAAVASWTSTSIALNDEIEFVVDSATTVTRINLVVYVTKT